MAIPAIPAHGASWDAWAAGLDAAARSAAQIPDVASPGTATGAALRAAFGALPKVAATVTASGALVPNQHNPVNATSGAKAMTLPTGQPEGTQIGVEKTDASTNAVSVTGNVRGVGSTTITLPWQNEDILFRADSAGSWWPISGHKTKSSLDAAYGFTGTVVDVTKYGAVGNNTAFDNADAVDAAMAAAVSASGAVLFPKGDFRFSRPIVLKAPIIGAESNQTQLRPLAAFSGTFAIDMNDSAERKFIKNVRISGAGLYGCIGSTNDGKGSSLTLFEDVWFTDTSTANYAVDAQSSTSGAGALTGAVFLRCAWNNAPHMVRVGDNQDDVTFIGCRFNMISTNKPSTAPILLRGQNEKQIGCYYHLDSTTAVSTVKEFIQVGAHVVSIENGFFEVQGGTTTNLTHLVWAAEPACHLSMRDITYRRTGTSSMTKAVYTESVAGTTANDSVIELKNWRVIGGTLATAIDILVSSPAASRLFQFSGIDTFSSLLSTAAGTTAAAATDYLRVNGEWRGTTYGHTVSHDAALTLSYTNALLGKLDFPPTSVDPRGARSTDVAVVGTTANTALYYRVRDGGTISKIALEVTTVNGNLSVGVYSNSGAGRSAAPSAQKATSGAVACPAIGVQEIALTSSVRVEPGDWIAISSDSTTAAFRSTITSEQTTALGGGLCYKQAAAHPLPSTPSTLTAISGRNILLVGTA